MSKKSNILLALLTFICAALLYLFIANIDSMAILSPRGEIADKQRNLIILTTLMSVLIIVPVFFMTFYFVWKYREGNKKAKYQPDWDHSVLAETIWWTVPLIMILILAGITWKTSHDLDPFKPINSSTNSLTIQVVALDWKWLFIYPDQGIASVNELYIPVNRPINFTLTADSPMSAMWIPKLGSQIYAMKGMSTKLSLMSSETGVFKGSNTNITGKGYSDMYFKVHSVNESSWQDWIKKAEKAEPLNYKRYQELAKPSRNIGARLFVLEDKELFGKVVMKYASSSGMDHNTDSNHEARKGSH